MADERAEQDYDVLIARARTEVRNANAELDEAVAHVAEAEATLAQLMEARDAGIVI